MVEGLQLLGMWVNNQWVNAFSTPQPVLPKPLGAPGSGSACSGLGLEWRKSFRGMLGQSMELLEPQEQGLWALP